MKYYGTHVVLPKFSNDVVFDYSIVNGGEGLIVDSSGKFITVEGNGTFYQSMNP